MHLGVSPWRHLGGSAGAHRVWVGWATLPTRCAWGRGLGPGLASQVAPSQVPLPALELSPPVGNKPHPLPLGAVLTLERGSWSPQNAAFSGIQCFSGGGKSLPTARGLSEGSSRPRRASKSESLKRPQALTRATQGSLQGRCAPSRMWSEDSCTLLLWSAVFPSWSRAFAELGTPGGWEAISEPGLTTNGGAARPRPRLGTHAPFLRPDISLLPLNAQHG